MHAGFATSKPATKGNQCECDQCTQKLTAAHSVTFMRTKKCVCIWVASNIHFFRKRWHGQRCERRAFCAIKMQEKKQEQQTISSWNWCDFYVAAGMVWILVRSLSLSLFLCPTVARKMQSTAFVCGNRLCICRNRLHKKQKTQTHKW